MSQYTVVWDKDVEEHFVNGWVAADARTRATLTEVANWIDANFAIDPD